MTLSRTRRRAAALLVGAALTAPLAPTSPATAAPSVHHASVPSAAPATARPQRPTRLDLAAYGDADASGAVHLSGWLRWSGGKPLGRPQRLELWARTGSRWARARTVTTDRAGEVEVRVRPDVRTTYQLRYAGLPATASRPAAPSRSRTLVVRAVARVTLQAPASARRGETFVVRGSVTGSVLPGGSRSHVVLTGNGATFTTLAVRADGTFSGHVRLRMTTTLAVRARSAAGVDGPRAAPRTVRVV